MQEQIIRIKERLEKLKAADKQFQLFGAEKHKYLLNPPLSKNEILAFEKRYGIQLPADFALFLTEVGNGGAGPFYGIEPLEDMLFNDLDYKKKSSKIDLTKPFPYKEPYNIDFPEDISDEELEALEKDYYAHYHVNGRLNVSNYGCGVTIGLIVNGEDYGKMWSDDRGSEAGVYPSFELGNEDKIAFLDWYELWLDNSLKEAIPQRVKPSFGHFLKTLFKS
jgi:hypothetical protein